MLSDLSDLGHAHPYGRQAFSAKRICAGRERRAPRDAVSAQVLTSPVNIVARTVGSIEFRRIDGQ